MNMNCILNATVWCWVAHFGRSFFTTYFEYCVHVSNLRVQPAWTFECWYETVSEFNTVDTRVRAKIKKVTIKKTIYSFFRKQKCRKQEAMNIQYW